VKLSKKYKNVISLITCVLSAYISAFAIKVFMEPSNLLSGGVTGVALLINTLTTNTNFQGLLSHGTAGLIDFIILKGILL
jgi:uncharacterized membrane-anchored protein YitT (DUF2179 family)